MLIADAGGGGPVSPYYSAPPAGVSDDPAVNEAVDATVAASEFGQPTDGAQVAYQISETMARDDLTQAQKDEYIAALVQLGGGQNNFYADSLSETQEGKIQAGLNDIGEAWTGPATTELRSQVTSAIARGVADGRLDGADLYGLVAPGGAGARQLLIGVRDGTMLSGVADALVADARAAGYDINDYQRGPELLTAAADIANMAGDSGSPAGANAVLAEIERVNREGGVTEGMTLAEAMMATTVGGNQWNNLHGRDGFHALSGILNSASQNAANQPALDRLFGQLVRSGGDEGYIGGIEEGGDERVSALHELGQYFDRNVDRLALEDRGAANTGTDYFRLVQDFTQHVMLDPDYPRMEESQDAMAGAIANLAARADNPSLTNEQRIEAAGTLGVIMGSIRQAGENYIGDVEDAEQAKVDAIRQFTDLFTDKLIGKLDAVPGAGAAANGLVDSLYQKLVDHRTAMEQGRVDSATGGLVEMLQAIRIGLQDGAPPSVEDAFDDREDIYHDGD